MCILVLRKEKTFFCNSNVIFPSSIIYIQLDLTELMVLMEQGHLII